MGSLENQVENNTNQINNLTVDMAEVKTEVKKTNTKIDDLKVSDTNQNL